MAYLDLICKALDVSPMDLMNEEESTDNDLTLPTSFDNPQDALSFILKMPTLAAYGGYDLDKMDDATLMEFANEILGQIRLVSYKYR